MISVDWVREIKYQLLSHKSLYFTEQVPVCHLMLNHYLRCKV